MIHYTCDRCQRRIDPAQESRYVVQIEVQATLDLANVEDVEEDRDHLLEIHELLESADLDELESYDQTDWQRRTYDLCPQCYRKYLKDPLGAETVVRLGFSHN